MSGALAIILSRGSSLMIKRGVEPHIGYWCPPGGVRDEGESLEETARREVKEETGLDVEVVGKLGEVVGPITGDPHSIHLCTPTGGSLRPSSPEVAELRWVPYQELSELLVPPFIRRFLESLDLRQLERSISLKDGCGRT